ncbi:EsaB/YukD family protein [Pseudoclavibacter helvolus]|uniref:EsaB/YukD family protein n=2 Tax=Pseudoclavibacter helvolus TaxID=255205 RepID=UPI00373586FE
MSYTRLTVIGTERKAELALPNGEPVGALLPHVLELLEEKPRGGDVLTLTTLTGASLDFDASLEEQGVRPGAMLRVTTADDAPQAPEVIDITDAITEAGASRRDAWTEAHTRVTLAVAAGAAAAGATMWAMGAFALPAQWMLAGVALLAALGAGLARSGQGVAAVAIASAAFGAAVPAAFGLAAEIVPGAGAGAGVGAEAGAGVAGAMLPNSVLVAAMAAWFVLGLVWGVGFQRSSARYGAAVGLLASSILFFLGLAGFDRGGVAVVASVLSVAALGLLPGAALSLSGLTSYDDRIMRGERASTRDVRAAIAESFAQLTWTVIAVSVVALLSLSELLLSTDAWRQGLAAALAVVALLRMRTFPLAPPRIALLVAVVVPAVLWLLSTTLVGAGEKALIAGIVALVAVAAAAWRPSEVVAAKLRRWADIVELLVVLTVVPLALGSFGIFADLLEAFR